MLQDTWQIKKMNKDNEPNEAFKHNFRQDFLSMFTIWISSDITMSLAPELV